MNKTSQTFGQFVSESTAQISLIEFSTNLLLAFLLSYAVGIVYTHFGQALSNRRAFARNFVVVSMSTMFIITIVKSSLALSLGLVGALSIVRFRTAIKEPEELAHVFLSIAIGLGMGANQKLITVVATLVILSVIMLRSRFSPARTDRNLQLIVTNNEPDKLGIDDIVDILKEHCLTVILKRFDEKKGELEVVFIIEIAQYDNLIKAKKAIQDRSEGAQFTFLDNSGGYY
ncbi:MAG: DUF4956 domain-containing protein [Magnetococcales bacterium]|nr:DUF4956 domain-containing protein [Magnetococcales bacterium]